MRVNHIFLALQKFKNVIFIILGNGCGKGISALGSLLVARLYAPKEFGTLSIYLSIFMICSCFVTLQLENAVVFVKRESEAQKIALTALVICSMMSIFTGVFLLFVSYCSSKFNFQIPNYLSLILIFHLIAYGYHEILINWSLRKMKFKLIATSQIILHFSLISIQIILGYLKYNTAIHLIIGFMGGYMFSLLYLGIKNKALLKKNFYINFSLKILKKHMHYIIYSVFPALLDQIRLATPIFLLNKYFSSDAGGLFFLSLKILNFPLTLFGNAFSKVILQKYSHNFNKHHSINEITKEFFPIVLTCGFVSYLSILILGKNFFLIILGENWVNIIPIISILCLGVCAEFFALPFLNIFSVVKQQNILGIWKASFLIVMILGLYLSLKTSMLSVFLWVYSLINTVLYIISFLLNIKTVKLVDFKND